MVKHLNSTGPVQYASALTELVRATAFGSRIVDWLHLRFPNKCLYSLQLHPYRAHCTRRCKVQRSFYIICTHVCAAAIYINATKLRGMMVKSMYIHTNMFVYALSNALDLFESSIFPHIGSFIRSSSDYFSSRRWWFPFLSHRERSFSRSTAALDAAVLLPPNSIHIKMIFALCIHSPFSSSRPLHLSEAILNK